MAFTEGSPETQRPTLGACATAASAHPAGAGVLRRLRFLDELAPRRHLVDGVDAAAAVLDDLGDVLEVDVVALERDLDVLHLVVDLEQCDVDAMDTLKIAELVGEGQHRRLVR